MSFVVVPVVRDRIVQAVVKIVLESVFEADVADCSFGFCSSFKLLMEKYGLNFVMLNG